MEAVNAVAAVGATFSAQWLANRERFDARARDRAWPALRAPMQQHAASIRRVLDLGCGTGSNLRYLAHRLASLKVASAPDWLLIDADPHLLNLARARQIQQQLLVDATDSSRAMIRYLQADLADSSAWPEFRANDLITAAALIDLVAQRWLAELIDRCCAVGAALYLALTYDGRSQWRPCHPLDAHIVAAFNRDQHTDKGFGAALGPAASSTAIALLERAGYAAWSAPTDWLLDAQCRSARRDTSRLIAALIADHARIATLAEPAAKAQINQWAAQRVRQLRHGQLRLRVGHVDILALPRTDV